MMNYKITSFKDWRVKQSPLKMLLFCCLFLGFMLNSNNSVQAQSVPLGSSIHVNFGVDADVYSGLFSFSPDSGMGTDDWVQGATGLGVIDETNAADIAELASGANVSKEFRMSVPVYTVVNGDTWIDAVYIRDQNTNGGNMDSNVFGAGDDKNFDDPSTWTIKEGDVPQKNDIIDIYAHLRRDSDAVFPNNDDEWAFAAASTRSDNGTSYIDFEYFREKVTYIPDEDEVPADNNNNGTIVTGGTDCGHTSYEFDLASGAVITHGDVILSANYTNGGSVADVRLYAWIDSDDFPGGNASFTAFNSLAFRPFNFGDENGNFEFYNCNNDNNIPYGYARISLRSDITGEAAIFAQVNTSANVAAPSWGTIDPGGSFTNEYISPTLAEFGINATLLGLDTRSTGGECQAPLGSVIVKTRSSDSFTAELKDMAGPFDLGDTPEYTVTLAGGDLDCFMTEVILTATAQPPGTYTYEWYKDGVLIPGTDPNSNTYAATEPGVYKVFATVMLAGFPGCTAESEEFTVNSINTAETLIPDCPDTDAVSCTDDIDTRFNDWKNPTGFTYEGGGGTVIEAFTYYIDDEEVTLENFTAPSVCGGGVAKIRYAVSDDCEQEEFCETTFTVAADDVDPEIVDVPDYQLANCNDDWPAFLTTDWTDNCSAGGQGIQSDGGVDDGESEDGCIQYRLYTFTITDDCGNDDTETTRVAREYDMTDPEIVDVPDYQLANCNDDWPAFLTTDWTDNCSAGGQGIQSDGGVDDGESEDGCIQYRLYTFTITDDCGNDDTETTRVSREYDMIDPVITCPEDLPTLCNDEFPSLSAKWTDNCSAGGTLTLDGPTRIVLSEDGCSQIGYYDFEVYDDCGNLGTETCTIIREFDLVDNCETAFAKADSGDQCFIPDFRRWGWTNYLPNYGVYKMDLWAGAAHCDTNRGELVGVVHVTYTESQVEITYEIFEGFTMNEAHVYVGCDPYPENRGRPTVAPGQYPFNPSFSGNVYSYTVVIDNEMADNSEGIYVIAHAVTCEIVCMCSPEKEDIYSDDSGETEFMDAFECEEGNETISGIVNSFKAYPVPFDKEVNIAYNIPYETDVTLEIFDIKGALIRKVENVSYIKGTEAVTTIDMTNTDNQLFLVRLTTKKGVMIKKIVSFKPRK
ncbi:T9SS type A sorting domain-containing protein [Hanstruepera flava]|uniref:T9SS type A sorting domain-containing protein n=1 Tax=Hanstruepera flava TaxID=2930218 RepID=UPI0020288E66|nr:T9SS type A sorting domain-containing protein [Hanstruepera flava]